MRTSGRILAAGAALAMLAGAGPAAAQPIDFPASQWNKLNPEYRGKQLDMVSSFNRRAPNFERIDSFSRRNRYRRLAAPIGRIEFRFQRPDGRIGVGYCTGTVISQRYILTNYHCIPGKGGSRVLEAQIRFGYLTRKTWGRKFKLATRPVEGDSQLDYAVVEVANNPSRFYGSIRLKTGAAEAGEELFIIHHPLGQPKRLTRKDCRAAPQGHLNGNRLRHVCDTEGGSSGSLVFSDVSGRLVALHFAGGLSANRPGSANNAIRIGLILQHSRILKSLAAGQAPAAAATPRTRPGSVPRPRANSGDLVPPPPPPATPGAAPAPAPAPASGPAQDAQLAGFMVGNWNGQLRNGRRSILRLRRGGQNGGRFQMIDPARRIAVVGNWRIADGRLMLSADKLCRPGGCQAINPARQSAIGIERVDQNTMRTPNGIFRRAQ